MIDGVRTDRRALLLGACAIALAGPARAETPIEIIIHRDPSCGCCSKWAAHLKDAGYATRILDTPMLSAVKARLGVPASLKSCHTAEVGGYVVEGHVPAQAIARLLAEKPQARGLAVPGMPIGSPGMEVDGMGPDTYGVMLFGDGEPRVFMRFRGAEAV